MARIQAKGRLRHCFHGTYAAIIALEFADENAARDAHATLGAAWRPGKTGPNMLVWEGSYDALEDLKKTLTFHVDPCDRPKCRKRKTVHMIDSIAHSIDVGPPFRVTIDVTPKEQGSLPGVT